MIYIYIYTLHFNISVLTFTLNVVNYIFIKIKGVLFHKVMSQGKCSGIKDLTDVNI